MRKVEYLVPPGVTEVECILAGGDGGAAEDGTPGERGETTHVRKRVEAGQVLTFYLGEGGRGAGGGRDGQDAMLYVWPIEDL